jgi:hypothetical protein
MSMKFLATTGSDDRIGFSFNGKEMDFDSGEMKFVLTLPGGQRIPGKVEYVGSGWDFSLELPMSTAVGIIDPDACQTCNGKGSIPDPELLNNTLWCPDCHEKSDEPPVQPG